MNALGHLKLLKGPTRRYTMDPIRRHHHAPRALTGGYLLEKLVLKGGNALSLVYSISTRASLDIDLSI